MHPRRIRDGVHEGVIDGGNQSGIPYSRGFECFDERFLGKPLVYCGTLGTIPVEVGGRPSERKEIEVGDWVVMCGGRIGKDGIHGATFSSEELRTESPAQAVQIGDPLTQRKLYEFILKRVMPAYSGVLRIMERGASPVRLVRWASIRVDVSVNSRAHRSSMRDYSRGKCWFQRHRNG